MADAFSIVRASLEQNLGKSRSWRDSLRARLSQDQLHNIIAELAEGKAWMAQLPDGQISVPVLPSSDIRLRAAMFLHEALYGKAVAQTEIQKAEQEAKEFEAIRALDDDQLEAEALKIIDARRVGRLTPGPIADAEFTIDVPAPSWEVSVWEASPTGEQDGSD